MSKLIRRIFLTDLTKVPFIINTGKVIGCIFSLTILLLLFYFFLWILFETFPSLFDQLINLLIGKY